MKKLLLFLLCIPFLSQSQNIVMWSEGFGFGCNTGTPANNFFSVNSAGTWTVTSTGDNQTVSNNWFISASENGNGEGECGSGCGNDPTLHIGSENSFAGTDLGASYYEGLDGFCDLIDCGTTNKRAESPVINCSGMANIVLNFFYLEGGNALDNATVWYFDGTDWMELADPPKTDLICSPQGVWTAFSIPLPSSSNNNENVKLGFQWSNNDDGDATDPSFAVDDIFLTGDFATDAVAPQILCPGDDIIYTDEFCAMLGDYSIQTFVLDDVDPFPNILQTPEIGTPLTPGVYEIMISATDNSGNSNFCTMNVTVIDDDAPEITCLPDVSAIVPQNQTDVFVTVPIPDVVENCGNYTLINDFNNTDDASGTYPIGSTTVNFLAIDDSGNQSDCAITINVAPPNQDCCLGDFNCDTYISVLDLLMLLQEFGCTNSCFTDLDDNGIVGVADMQIFTGLYGTTCP